MKKEEQKAINWVCDKMFDIAQKELYSSDDHGNYIYPWYQLKSDKWKRLRSMQAKIIETEHYYFLQSYDTIVAFINKETDECYDVLRLVYGYTATSAKHISAFDHDYGKGKWGCKARLTWRDV